MDLSSEICKNWIIFPITKSSEKDVQFTYPEGDPQVHDIRLDSLPSRNIIKRGAEKMLLVELFNEAD